MSATVHQISHADTVCVVPHALIPRAVTFLTCRIDAGFPSSAADDYEEPIDLAAWLVEHPAASYVMRVQGWSMPGPWRGARRRREAEAPHGADRPPERPLRPVAHRARPAGFRRDWWMRAENRSPAWTTRIAEVPAVDAS